MELRLFLATLKTMTRCCSTPTWRFTVSRPVNEASWHSIPQQWEKKLAKRPSSKLTSELRSNRNTSSHGSNRYFLRVWPRQTNLKFSRAGTTPNWGAVPPDKFIEVAEHIGMLPQLTASVLRKSCEHARLWPAIGLSMNISAREACDPATPLRILETLNQCQFPPHLLDVEVTEHALIKDLDAARQVVAALRSVGITVYIDDFGEGYSGIGYLRELVIDGIKIDRSCVKDICNNEQAAVFLKSLLLMANALGCKTVAEGIETLDVWQKAKEIGVDFGQGYFFAKPMPASEVGRFLQISPEIASGRVLAFSRP